MLSSSKYLRVYFLMFITTFVGCSTEVDYCTCIDIIEGNGDKSNPELLHECLDQYAKEYDQYRDEMDSLKRSNSYEKIQNRKKECDN